MAPRKSKAKATKKTAPGRKAVSTSTAKDKAAKAPHKTKLTKKAKTDVNVLPHGLSVQAEPVAARSAKIIAHEASTQKALVVSPKVATQKTTTESLATNAGSIEVVAESKLKRVAKSKDRLGATPYPEFARPTADECYELKKILTEAHGEVRAPENIPVPSRRVAGCGEVKFVLEALIRTHLSAHTSMDNANKAIRGLLKRYPTFKDGPCASSIDWNEVRLGKREKLEKAIKQGGMAPKKSRFIKTILDQVYEENQARREELKEKVARAADAKEAQDEIETIEVSQDPLAGDTKATIMARFADQILLEHENVLTLDYVHAMHPSDAFEKLRSYNGIGDKTAACVLLFCMQRPFFAVDTHVWRLCRWLGWVPPTADRNKTFYHCDVKVPDDLKYSLHQLMIAHGKDCGRCRANTSEKSEAWAEGCPIEEIVKRTGQRKGGEDPPKPKGKKSKKRKSNAKGTKSTKQAKKVKDSKKTPTNKKQKNAIVSTRSNKRKATTKQPEDDNDDLDFEPKAKRAKSSQKTTARKDEDNDSEYIPKTKKAKTPPKKVAPNKKSMNQAQSTSRNIKATTRGVKTKVEVKAAATLVSTLPFQDVESHHSPSSQESIASLAEAMVASDQDDNAMEQFTPPTEQSD